MFDKQVRHYIYEYFVKTGQAPTLLHCTQVFSCPITDVRAAFQRLANGRALVLQSNGEILMAEPFSAVPTMFSVEVGSHTWWGNCIWDALGILAMLQKDGRVVTACGCCNDAMCGDSQRPAGGCYRMRSHCAASKGVVEKCRLCLKDDASLPVGGACEPLVRTMASASWSHHFVRTAMETRTILVH